MIFNVLVLGTLLIKLSCVVTKQDSLNDDDDYTIPNLLPVVTNSSAGVTTRNSTAPRVTTSDSTEGATEYEVVEPNGLVYVIPFNAAFRKLRGMAAVANVTPDSSDVELTNRIVGGEFAEEGDFTYQIALMLQDFGFYCSGSIYKSDTLITAAHCFFDDGVKIPFKEILVVAGKTSFLKNEPYEQLRTIRHVILHPEFRPEIPSIFDLAIVQLNEPLCLNHGAQPIDIPPEDFLVKGKVEVSGWGLTERRGAYGPHDRKPSTKKHSRRLKKGNVNIVSLTLCQRAYIRAGYAHNLGLVSHNSVICAGLADGSVDSCQGDSGGPLTCTDKNGKVLLCGVVSTGIGCGLPNLPALYSNVAKFRDWIITNAGNADTPCTVIPHTRTFD